MLRFSVRVIWTSPSNRPEPDWPEPDRRTGLDPDTDPIRTGVTSAEQRLLIMDHGSWIMDQGSWIIDTSLGKQKDL